MEYHQAISTNVSSRPVAANATSDAMLVARIAKGDKNAVRLLFARHHLRVFRFILRMVKNEETAQDLLNDVFLDVWRGAATYQSRSQVTTWILGIARFKALTALRQRSFEALDEEAAERIEDPSDSPEVQSQLADRRAIMQECLSQLSRTHREVVDLIYYHEQTIEEVAQIIGVPENTVKTRAFYARKRIAELMAARGIDRAWL
jgi:RNA polymerase sigma-70 factor (ECF subfamily)